MIIKNLVKYIPDLESAIAELEADSFSHGQVTRNNNLKKLLKEMKDLQENSVAYQIIDIGKSYKSMRVNPQKEGNLGFYEILESLLCSCLPVRFGISTIPTEVIVKDAISKFADRCKSKNVFPSGRSFLEYLRVYRKESPFINMDFDFAEFQFRVEELIKQSFIYEQEK